jgi:Ala-tRNA(Pro) deacylase
MASATPPADKHGHVDVARWLDERGIDYQVVEHDETFTAAAEARAAHVAPEHTAKTVVLRDGEEFVMAVIPASERLDLHKVRDVLDRGPSLRLATEEEMAARFPEFEVGAVPPFGPTVPELEVVDSRLAEEERTLYAGGDHRHSLLVDAAAIRRAAQARIADICED